MSIYLVYIHIYIKYNHLYTNNSFYFSLKGEEYIGVIVLKEF